MAVALPPEPVDDPSEAVVVVEASVVVVVDDDGVPVVVELSDMVGREKSPLLVLLLMGVGRIPVGVGVASGALSAQ